MDDALPVEELNPSDDLNGHEDNLLSVQGLKGEQTGLEKHLN